MRIGKTIRQQKCTPCKGKMITRKMLTNDLIVMEKQGLIKKAGHTYNQAGDPEQRYELTQAGPRHF
jgi:DNA-binding HxlR family transcriptional regulator